MEHQKAVLTHGQLTNFLREMLPHRGKEIDNVIVMDAAIEAGFFTVQPNQPEPVLAFPDLRGTEAEITAQINETAGAIMGLVNDAAKGIGLAAHAEIEKAE